MDVEHTVLLRQDVTCSRVAREIRQRGGPAGAWRYGKYWEKADSQGNTRREWSGMKCLWMTPAWCEVIGVIGVLDVR